MRKKLLPVFIVFLVLLVDRVSKFIIIRKYSEGEGIELLPGVFHLTRVNNQGAAFGVLRESPQALVFISILFIFFLIFYIFFNLYPALGRETDPEKEKWAFFSACAWSLVMAGAAGNLFDRMMYGYVIDFLDLRVWPVFNFADISICIGAFFAAFGFIQKKKPRMEHQ